ncbi:hypothetical protein PHLCEN_2v3736 [Hermanssonia centrifuga]|uniref:Pinin/SDK/MemA protein domain-containing protein n=1 Tax=Hermanssonia centrifuga TaxID=98765 RepID=A0A2R6QBM1_9APHY|nr:hypothetical protein PHLCEN_2v3736 [Hermanssonia centrifuga]
MSTGNKKRPRLDLATDTRERKRGKSMFGLVLGTLNKAKNEDKQRNASEAAKKRQLIEQRLQDKLRKETDSVRRAEEAKKDKTIANRKEEELQLKDSIYKLRRTRIPLLANFLSTSDQIPSEEAESTPSTSDPLAPVPRAHPPPLYYLPAILTPAQEAFLKRRKAEVTEAAEKEWETFRAERTTSVEDISGLRQRVAEEEERKKSERSEVNGGEAEQDVKMGDEDAKESNGTSAAKKNEEPLGQMEVDDESRIPPSKDGKKEPVRSLTDATPAGMTQTEGADEDDAVEY